MPNRFSTHSDIFIVILSHLGAVGLTLTAVEDWLKVLSLIVAIGYTCWKWRREWLKLNK